MILIDLQKAFDTIDHKILQEKMIHLGFSTQVVNWFNSYLSNRIFHISIDNALSDSANLNCGVPQGSILGPLLFLLYVNYIPQAIDCQLFLYADDSCLVFQHKDAKEIEKQLNKDFSNICDWFVDNKFSIHFGEDKTKSILFSSKNKSKKIGHLNISYQDKEIKQYSKVANLGCILDETLSGESTTLKVLKTVNSRLRFPYRENRFLTPSLHRLLCNALIQPHFDYVCSAWYPNLHQNLKNKLQAAQNKCIRFCLQLNSRTHIGTQEFKKINWLPIDTHFNQCVTSSIYKYFNKKCPSYMSEVYVPIELNN